MKNPAARTVDTFMRQAMVDWCAHYEKLSTDERMHTNDHAAATCERLARFVAYTSRRMAGGKHTDAVRAQNTAGRRVRQALGFTYADDKITF